MHELFIIPHVIKLHELITNPARHGMPCIYSKKLYDKSFFFFIYLNRSSLSPSMYKILAESPQGNNVMCRIGPFPKSNFLVQKIYAFLFCVYGSRTRITINSETSILIPSQVIKCFRFPRCILFEFEAVA